MTNPFANPQQPPGGFGQNPQQGQPAHNQVPPGFNNQNQGPNASGPAMPQPPEKKSSSKKVLWIVLAVVLVLAIIAAVAVVAAVSFFKDVAADFDEAPRDVAASDDAYWNSTYDADDVDRIRASEEAAPVPAPLIELSDECYEDTSFFGQSDFLSLDVQWVPTISCIYGPDREFVAQYTENADAIRDTESVGLSDSVEDFTSARGSQIAAFGEAEEYVIAEVLEDGSAVIEYVMDGYDDNGDEADLNDLATYLVGAGILELTPGGPPVDA
ncbi:MULTISPECIES: hypothetical protein [unclassified Corynebacterium]|uniref:hypothetical protein n=1 Tax=unclassified Corynebacterium TaxID=2624378 RepID=UPI001FF054E2|nr:MULTISPECIES: hypothetical protein [unclassified Corynebacterium]